VSLLTGPEGGLEESEVEQARQAGLQVCTLGSRILRCETAPLCALSAVMYDAGEF
jgi:16S rRNA (uracil1498-N3)-methyltransferase